jgi:hypothetical protein
MRGGVVESEWQLRRIRFLAGHGFYRGSSASISKLVHTFHTPKILTPTYPHSYSLGLVPLFRIKIRSADALMVVGS